MIIQAVRFALVLVGALAGARLAAAVALPEPFSAGQASLIVLMILGSAVGYLVGGVLGATIQSAIIRAESRLTKIPIEQLMLGVIGLILGLITAVLASLPFRLIEQPEIRIPVTAAVFLVLGRFGYRVAAGRSDDFSAVFQRLGIGGRTTSESSIPPKLVDTNIIIDGRLGDLVSSGFLEGRIVVPRFVLDELQKIADSGVAVKRSRGRRGLDILNAVRKEIEVDIVDEPYDDVAGVDSKLVAMAKDTGGIILTNDYNLNKVAQVEGVKVLNLNDLANAIKPASIPGEDLSVKVVREGREQEQGVGYLDDGTMVVIEKGKELVGETVSLEVTSVLQTPAGRMIFGRPKKKA